MNRKLLYLVLTVAMFTLFISSAHARLTHTDYSSALDDDDVDCWGGCYRPRCCFVVPEVPLGTIASLSAMFLGIASIVIIKKAKSK